jgi:hypothetical protein
MFAQLSNKSNLHLEYNSKQSEPKTKRIRTLI